MTREKVLVIVGPTAVGKTRLGVELAQRFNGEVISGDSLQVYRKLDIGTAKVTAAEQQGIPHHLIDCRNMDEHYSVADFQAAGSKLINELTARGKLPIVVGGTGLYIQALIEDFQLGSRDESPELRASFEQFAEAHGNEALWQRLAEKDPLAADAIHPNNRRKLIRALEVLEKSGASIVQPTVAPAFLYDALLIGLTTERALLYDRINLRVDQMMNQGLLNEAHLLFEQSPQPQAAQGIGYKEFFPYFRGEEPLDTAVARVKQNSRRYAKRQLTWFRNRMPVTWWDLVETPQTQELLEEEVEQWLTSSRGE